MHSKLTRENIELLLSEMERYGVEEVDVDVDVNWNCIDFDIFKNGNFTSTVFTIEGN